MGAATQAAADVLRKRPYVRALAALNRNVRLKPVKAQELQLVNGDFPGRPVQLYSLTRVLIERLAVALQGRIHRRYLFDLAPEFLQRRVQFVAPDTAESLRRLRDDMPGQVA